MRPQSANSNPQTLLLMILSLFTLPGARRLSALLALAAGLLLAPTHALAQAGLADTVGERLPGRGGEGAAHLVINYRCDPANRAAFREFMDTKGVNQFEAWKKAGVFRDYLILFSTFSSSRTFDMWVTLYFDRFADIGKWIEVEKKFPGGLSPEGHKLARPDGTVYTDVPWVGGKRKEDIANSVFMIIPYRTLVSVSKYEDYANAYVVPQLKGWVKLGIMPSYEMHQNINPTNAPWDILMVFEYDGLRGIALRDTAKNEVRKDLLKDPGYMKYSPIKLEFRKEDEPTTYMAILPKK
jgi:hypothetical protein